MKHHLPFRKLCKTGLIDGLGAPCGDERFCTDEQAVGIRKFFCRTKEQTPTPGRQEKAIGNDNTARNQAALEGHFRLLLAPDAKNQLSKSFMATNPSDQYTNKLITERQTSNFPQASD